MSFRLLGWIRISQSHVVHFYSKCRFAQFSLRVFNTMRNNNPIAYNAVISGLVSNGLGSEAIEVFNNMLEDGFKPDKATFSGVLRACAHSGILEEGSRLFARVRHEFASEHKWEGVESLRERMKGEKVTGLSWICTLTLHIMHYWAGPKAFIIH